MKETLVKQEIKMEWDGHHTDHNNSPQVPGGEEQTTSSPQSVITTRRHVRTITTAGHITEGIAEVEPESPDSVGNLHHGLHPRNEQHEQAQQRNYQEEQQQQQQQQQQQHYVQISHPGAEPDQPRPADQQRVVYATSNGQEVQVEVSETSETTITLTVKEPPR